MARTNFNSVAMGWLKGSLFEDGWTSSSAKRSLPELLDLVRFGKTMLVGNKNNSTFFGPSIQEVGQKRVHQFAKKKKKRRSSWPLATPKADGRSSSPRRVRGLEVSAVEPFGT